MLSVFLFLFTFQAKAIVGGEFASLSHPVSRSTVSLNFRGRSFCTGTLISRVHVLTAAHCLTSGRRFQVGFGVTPRRSIFLPVRSVVIHPEYDPNNSKNEPEGPPNDIAIILLDEIAPRGFVPTRLPSRSVVPDEPLLLSGFGIESFNGRRSGRLKLVATKVLRTNELAKEIRFGPTPGRSACRGDSGGPAYVVSENGRLVVVGATSRGLSGQLDPFGDPTGCVGEGFYTDVYAHTNWILNNL